MFKRVSAISLMLLANIMLLMFVAAPHHHHGDVVCFAGSHCHKHHEHAAGHGYHCDGHNTCPSEQEHQHDTDSSCCKIPEWILTDAASQKNECSVYGQCCPLDDGQPTLAAILPEAREPVAEPDWLPFRQKPFTDTYLRISVSRMPGLRAPPIC